jgi:hydrogenase-4 component B
MSWQTLMLVAGPAVPLCLCMGMLIPGLRSVLPALLPLAPAPALALALLVPAGHALALPATLPGAGLAVTPGGRIFLGIAALLWILAAVHARASVRDRPHHFAAWWFAALGGNLLLFVAADVVTFYLAFAAVSLGAFGLVIHTRTHQAMRAGRIYLVLAIVGESVLLLALMLGADAAGTTLLPDVAQSIADSPRRNLTLALLVIAFGIKAGLMPLHVWLPLAHPVAPAGASAVLSGAIVKAGIYGLVVFLPSGTDPGAWSSLLVTLGMLTTFGGALIGVAQTRAKTVLAYSTVSQMGLLVALLGVGLRSPDSGSIIAAVTLYAAHHSLAKGSLFLSVSLLSQDRGWSRRLAVAAAGLVALSIAGLPFTAGALAKLTLKSVLPGGGMALMLALGGITTTLVMLRFLQLAVKRGAHAQSAVSRAEVASFSAAALAALAIPVILTMHWTDLTPAYAATPANAWGTLWPVALGVGVFLAGPLLAPARWRDRVPEGDLVVPALRIYHHALTLGRRLRWPAAPVLHRRLPSPVLLARAAGWLEQWRIAGLLLLGLVGLLMLFR